MAREKVENKYRAILEAAVEVFAERGFWDTPTSLISRTAGVADGTLFNYFKTKDDLINEVYLEIKRELTHELLEGLSDYESVQDRMRHVWNRYIEWGVKHPERFKVMHQIGTSYELADEVKAQANNPFVEMQQMAEEMIARGEFKNYPVEYLGALMDSYAVTTVKFVSADVERMAYYQTIGFDILWSGVTQ